MVEGDVMLLPVVDGESKQMRPFRESLVNIKDMWSYKTLLHLSEVMPVDGKPASPHHSLERELKGFAGHGSGNKYFVLIDGHPYIRMFSGESR